MAEHDSGYKLLFSHPRMVEDLLRGFIHEPWVEELDFSTLEPAETSFTSADLRKRYSDKIWRLRWRGRERGWFYVYLLLEFQSTPDPFMGVRLLGYMALLYADLVRSKVATPARGLPAVLPIVLYNGKRPWGAHSDLASQFRFVPRGCERYLPQLSYLLVDENRLRPEELALSGNRVATLIRLEVCAPQDLPGLTAELAALLPPGKEPELRRDFTTWLLRLLRRLLPGGTMPEVGTLEEIAMLEETLTEWWKGAERKGRSEGLQSLRRTVLELMEHRFGPLPAGVRKRVRSITSLARLEALAREALRAASLGDLSLG